MTDEQIQDGVSEGLGPTAEEEEPRQPPDFECCLPPGECCMPGLHFPSECHTAADYQRRGR